MEIKEFLLPEAVVFIPKENILSKQDLLWLVAETASNVYGLDPESSFAALEAREMASSTGMGQGIALPHARSDDFEQIVGIFIRLETPIEFDSIDRKPVDLVFGMFAPNNSSIEYLKSLSGVARKLREEETQQFLRSTDKPKEILSFLT
ncbi:MAG: PTS sugar transporter subunit IIA [Rhodobacteraceae bacterium]|nr:PTS sugar transporter subunit IIA [Paracoccaceae bacterium]